MPLLTTGILQDTGKHQLKERMAELLDIVQQNPLSMMEQSEKRHEEKKKKKGASSDEPSTSEEKFIESALATVQLHAKAKMLVYDMVT